MNSVVRDLEEEEERGASPSILAADDDGLSDVIVMSDDERPTSSTLNISLEGTGASAMQVSVQIHRAHGGVSAASRLSNAGEGGPTSATAAAAASASAAAPAAKAGDEERRASGMGEKEKNKVREPEERPLLSNYFIKELISCPICFNYYKSAPIFSCPNGHYHCSSCNEKLSKSSHQCPECRDPKINIRLRFAEKIVERINTDRFYYECQFSCGTRAPFPYINLHEDLCVSRIVPCPGHISETCDWRGPLSELVKHAVDRKCICLLKADDDGCYTWYVNDSKSTSLFDTEQSHIWKPILLVSKAHMRLFAFIVFRRDPDGLWAIEARSHIGEKLLENLRIKLEMFSGPPSGSSPDMRSEEQKALEAHRAKELSFSVQGKFVPHDNPEKDMLVLLSDALVQPLMQHNTVFHYRVTISEVPQEGVEPLLSRRWFPAEGGFVEMKK